VCTGIVSTGSEGIKQHKIITIRGNRIRTGKVLMSEIDGVWSVLSPGLFRIVHGQGEMTLEDAEECDDGWNHFGFHRGLLGRWAGGSWT